MNYAAGSLSNSKVGGASILERIFKTYDSDGSGSISADEFKRMAYDMGFSHMANEAFAVLDADRSGYITYKEVLTALRSNVPRNMDTKKLLFGCIWSWGVKEVDGKKNKEAKIDTSHWRIRGSEVRDVYVELRNLLSGCGAHVSDMAKLFDEDAGGILQIDEVEFTKAVKRWGFRGMPAVLEDVFAAINTSHSGKIDFDEFFEYVRGHRHALDARLRNAKVRELVLEVPAGSDFALVDMLWEVEPSAFEAVESLRLLMQRMLLDAKITPSEMMRAWDRSGDKLLDRREFVTNLKWLLRKEPQLWTREMHRVAIEAFKIIQSDGADVDSKAMDVIELEQWLDAPTKRKPHALYPLKPQRMRKLKEAEKEKGKEKVVTRPGCDIQSRAEKAINEAKKLAADKEVRAKMLAEEQRRRYETRGGHSPEQLRQSGMAWPKVPWEVPAVVKGEPYKRTVSPSHEALPQLSPRGRRPAPGGEGSTKGSLLPLLSANETSPRGERSPKRAGGRRESREPWVDEAGQLHLPPKYRDLRSLTPRQLGLLTAVCTAARS